MIYKSKKRDNSTIESDIVNQNIKEITGNTPIWRRNKFNT